MSKQKLLFVCTINRMRSATAHEIYKDDNRFEVASAGTDKEAKTVLSKALLDWADTIVVMEKHHRNYIRKYFPESYNTKKILCLYIPDEYDYMQLELVMILKDRIEDRAIVKAILQLLVFPYLRSVNRPLSYACQFGKMLKAVACSSHFMYNLF